jgi:hypothetical protein
LCTLPDHRTEYQWQDRLCWTALHEALPEAKTIWLYREQLAPAGATDTG